MKQNKTTNNAKGYNININNRLTLPTGTYDANNNINNTTSLCKGELSPHTHRGELSGSFIDTIGGLSVVCGLYG